MTFRSNAALILLLTFALILVCFKSISQGRVAENCKDVKLDLLKELAHFLEVTNGKVYHFKHQEINLPEGFETMEWKTSFETIRGLDSLHTKFAVFGKRLKVLTEISTTCDYRLQIEDFRAIWPEPSILGVNNLFSYKFNHAHGDLCYNPDEKDILKYSNCHTSLMFSFSPDGQLKRVDTDFFFLLSRSKDFNFTITMR